MTPESISSTEQWSFPKWESELEVMPGVMINMARLMEEEGINLDSTL